MVSVWCQWICIVSSDFMIQYFFSRFFFFFFLSKSIQAHVSVCHKMHTFPYYFLLVSVFSSLTESTCSAKWAEHQACAGGSGSVMDRLTLSRIDGDLGSSEVAALCFLCLDVINRKRLEGVSTTYVVLLSLSQFPVWGIMSDWTVTYSTTNNLCHGLHQNKSAVR